MGFLGLFFCWKRLEIRGALISDLTAGILIGRRGMPVLILAIGLGSDGSMWLMAHDDDRFDGTTGEACQNRGFRRPVLAGERGGEHAGDQWVTVEPWVGATANGGAG